MTIARWPAASKANRTERSGAVRVGRELTVRTVKAAALGEARVRGEVDGLLTGVEMQHSDGVAHDVAQMLVSLVDSLDESRR